MRMLSVTGQWEWGRKNRQFTASRPKSSYLRNGAR